MVRYEKLIRLPILLNHQKQLLRLIIALKIYKANKRTYPYRLKALSPEILPEIPVDNLTGQPFIYRFYYPGFILLSDGELADFPIWSVGEKEPGYYRGITILCKE